MANNIGKITQIIGAVLDIKFTEGNLPEINDAIKVPTRDGKELVVEVSQHLGDDIVRCIARRTRTWNGCDRYRCSDQRSCR